ncbi:hypothetical protein DACRYDRAFT_22870 [Dacryopinax primogenitus]|uniref:Uncharacterized protein n=1 Tax=Dacryopinax primogenitus (strain DJM 731) TaxID=1858805 RepID=M5G5J2_DACPD|nr:uncharacterized protein DACRYDRAFT_22870 [Dacryopinax primogenitus]EJU01077.1 hypothetical protein DACRYDRAFT_22870 [Dacryopinax primogenitus]
MNRNFTPSFLLPFQPRMDENDDTNVKAGPSTFNLAELAQTFKSVSEGAEGLDKLGKISRDAIDEAKKVAIHVFLSFSYKYTR